MIINIHRQLRKHANSNKLDKRHHKMLIHIRVREQIEHPRPDIFAHRVFVVRAEHGLARQGRDRANNRGGALTSDARDVLGRGHGASGTQDVIGEERETGGAQDGGQLLLGSVRGGGTEMECEQSVRGGSVNRCAVRADRGETGRNAGRKGGCQFPSGARVGKEVERRWDATLANAAVDF